MLNLESNCKPSHSAASLGNAALSRAISALQNALQSIDNQAGYEFTAFDLISASQALEEILGIVTTDDLLNSIFNNFCIGK